MKAISKPFLLVPIFRRCLFILLVAMSASSCAQEANPKVIEVDEQKITYDLIYQDVSNLLDVTPNSAEVFVRWELPIRYYMEGLEDYPEKAKLMDEVAQEMASLTGLDIKRHDKIYWPSNTTMFHPDSPDNHFTNVHFFFYSDFESLSKSGYIQAAKLLGNSLEAERERFNKRKAIIDRGEAVSRGNHSGSKDSLMYYNSYQAFSDNGDITAGHVVDDWLDVLAPFLAEKIKLSISKRTSGRYFKSALTRFDRLFLSTYYQTNLTKSTMPLKHGINNEQAAKMIAKEVWHYYQQSM